MTRSSRRAPRSAPTSVLLLLALAAAGCAVTPAGNEDVGEAASAATVLPRLGNGSPIVSPPLFRGGAPHATCATAGTATLLSSTTAVVIAKDTIVGGSKAYFGSCSGADDSSSKMFAIKAAQTGTFTVSLAGVSPEADLALYVRSVCGAASTERACSETGGWGQGESVTFPVVAGTTYYAFVDGIQHGAGPGTFTLSAKWTAPPPVAGLSTTCSVAPVLLDAGGEIDFAGDTTSAGADLAVPTQLGTCGTAGLATAGADEVLAITAASSGTLHLSVAPKSGSSYDAVIYVETTCGAASSALACANDTSEGPESLTLAVTAGSTYFLVLDTAGGWSGAFTGKASLSVP